MKELNFIFLLIVICSISTVLLVISFFCYCNQRPHQHNIVNINHQSIDSGFGKLPIQIAYISILYILFFFFQTKYDEERVNGPPKTGNKDDFENSTGGIDNGLPKARFKGDFEFSTSGIVNGLPEEENEEESYEDFGISIGNSSVPTIDKLLFVVSLYFAFILRLKK